MFINRIFKNKRQNGDTIVEVLICIAVLGISLAGAYALSNRSLQSGLESSQRTAILNRAQGQVEFLRNAVINGTTATYTSAPQPFCINDTSGSVLSGTACNFTGPAHNMSITYDPATKIFTVRPTWTNIRNIDNKLELFYKLPEVFN